MKPKSGFQGSARKRSGEEEPLELARGKDGNHTVILIFCFVLNRISVSLKFLNKIKFSSLARLMIITDDDYSLLTEWEEFMGPK